MRCGLSNIVFHDDNAHNFYIAAVCILQKRNIIWENIMLKLPQSPKPQMRKNEYSNQSNDGKVSNNIRKDRATTKAAKENMENEGGKSPPINNKPLKT